MADIKSISGTIYLVSVIFLYMGNSMIKLSLLEEELFTWVFVESKSGIPEPIDLLHLEYPDPNGKKGVVLSFGKNPSWVIAEISSHFRNRTKWQGCYDASLGSAIVTFSLDPTLPRGKAIALNLPCLICHQQGIATYLRSGALYPYCHQEKHQDHAPERQRYRKRKTK